MNERTVREKKETNSANLSWNPRVSYMSTPPESKIPKYKMKIRLVQKEELMVDKVVRM